MFAIAPRARALDARALAMIATVLVAGCQAGSALLASFPLLFLARIGTGLGFGVMNAAVNLAAGRTAHPARAISLGITIQTVLFAGIAILLPLIGRDHGVSGMFLALAGISLGLGLLAALLPGGTGGPEGETTAGPHAALGPDAARILCAMALFAFGTLAIWPFIERTAHAIGIPATQFGRFQALSTLTSALGNAALAASLKRLPRAAPLALALGACGIACAALTTVGSAAGFGAALIAYNTCWFLTYPLLLGLAYATEPSGRLAVMTTGCWLLSQSLGSLAAGVIAQRFGGYTPIGPLGALACIAAIGVALPLARRLDHAAAIGA